MLETTTGLADHEVSSVVVAEPDAKFVVVPDAALLFTADYKRSGPDLVLTDQDGRHTVVQDYFKADNPLKLLAPNGAGLQPDVVDLLANAHSHDQYAQAGDAPAPPAPIATVKTLIGNVSVMRNGAEVTLKIGDPIYKSDIIQTASGAAVGISFPDGTALHITANARMALSDYSFDANSTTNGAFFHLIDGTFSFVAGQVARTGGLKIETPVGTVGIRGTTGWVQQVATISAALGNTTYSFAVVDDQNTDHTGIYDVLDSNGNAIATISQKGILTLLTGQGVGQSALVTTQAMTPDQIAFEQQIIQGVFNAVGLPGLSPRFDPGHDGSYQPPPLFQQHNELFGDHSTTFAFSLPDWDDKKFIPIATVVWTPPVLPVFQTATNHSPTLDSGLVASVPTNDPSPPGASIAAIFAGRFHDADAGASLAGIAVAGNTANPSTQGVWQYSTNGGSVWIDIGSVSASTALMLAADTLLRFLPAHNFYGAPPPLVVYGIDNSYAGGFSNGLTQIEINAAAGGSSSPVSSTPVEITTNVGANIWVNTSEGDPVGGDWSIGGNWTDGVPGPPQVVIIDLPAGQTVHFDGDGTPVSTTIAKLLNIGGGTLDVSNGANLKVQGPASNEGKIEATGHGEVSFKLAQVDNQECATIAAVGECSLVSFSHSFVENAGLILACDQGLVTFNHVFLDNKFDGVISAAGHGSVVELCDTTVVGGTLQTSGHGVIEVESRGTVFDGSQTDCYGCVMAVTIDGHVLIEENSDLTLRGIIHNHGMIEVDTVTQAASHLVIDGSVTLDGCGTVQLDGHYDSIIGSSGHGNVLMNVDNMIFGAGSIGDGGGLKLVNESDGVIDANVRCGTLTIDTGWHHVVNAGLLEATHGGNLVIDSDVSNDCGLVEAGRGSHVTVAGDIWGGNALINGGTLEYDGASNVSTAFACNASGTLVLGACSDFCGQVSGFGAGDILDFKGIDFSNCTDLIYCAGDGTLTVSDGGGHSSTVHLTGSYDQSDFAVFDDGCGHAAVAEPPRANDDIVIASDSALDDHHLTIRSDALLANDTNPIPGDEISLQSVSGGHACLDVAGNVSDRPYGSADQFCYTLEDDHGLQSTAQVQVSIQCGSLNGTCANEIILPGSDNACLTGGGGNDTFLFQNNVSTGQYAITDFTTHSQGGGADTITLDDFACITNFCDVLDHAQNCGGNTVIDLGLGNTVTIQNVSVCDLTAADFAIHHASGGGCGVP